MSLTAVVFLAVFALGLLLAFVKHPIFGLYAYLWTFYLGPETAWWSSALPGLRWSLIAAAVALTAAILRPDGTGRQPWYSLPSIRVLMLFVVWLWVQTAWALSLDDHLFLAILFTKYVVIFLLLYKVLDTQDRICNFLLVNVVGCFYWGYLAWAWQGGGRLESIGTGDVAGSAFASMHISAILALAAFIFLGYSGWRKWLPFFCVPLMLLAIVQMQTRGAFVGLVAGVPVALLFAPRGKRGWVVFYLLLGSLLFLRVANNDFWERMATIHTAEGQEMESSAASRFGIAEANWRMAKDYPMGVGHRGNDLLSPRYMPESLLTNKDGVQIRSAHDTVMAILVDHGIIGLVLIVVFHARIVATLLRLRARAAELSGETQALTGGLATALVIYWVNAQFANMTKAEVVIWIAAMAAALQSAVVARAAARTVAVTPAPGGGAPPPRTRPSHG